MPNIYQEKITAFFSLTKGLGGSLVSTISTPAANIARFHVASETIESIDIWTDFPTDGLKRFTVRKNGVDLFPNPVDQLDLAGNAHVEKTGLAISTADGDVISFDLNAVEGRVTAPLYFRLNTSDGGGGASALADLTDVDVSGVADGDNLTFDSGSGLWVPAAPSGGGGGGGLWESFFPNIVAPPSVAGGGWTLPNSTTLVQNGDSVRIDAGSGNDNVKLALRSFPVSNNDYDLKIGFYSAVDKPNGISLQCGVCFHDTTNGQLGLLSQDHAGNPDGVFGLRQNLRANATTGIGFSSTSGLANIPSMPRKITWLRLSRVSGGDKNVYYSANGIDWVSVGTIPFFTNSGGANRIGFYIDGNSELGSISVFSFSLT